MRQGRHHRPDHQQSIRGRGDGSDRQQARDRRREACQRPERGDRGACTGDELGPGHAQSARGEPHRRRRTLPRAPRLQRPADHVKLARPVPRHRGRLSVLGMGAGPASADLHPSAAGTDRTRPANGSVQARRTRGASVRHRHGARPHDSVGSVRPLSTAEDRGRPYGRGIAAGHGTARFRLAAGLRRHARARRHPLQVAARAITSRCSTSTPWGSGPRMCAKR